jgi:uncharacterized Zn finger protein (UPF0148 family)
MFGALFLIFGISSANRVKLHRSYIYHKGKSMKVTRKSLTDEIYRQFKKAIFEQVDQSGEVLGPFEKIKQLAELGKKIEQQVQNSLSHLNNFMNIGTKTEDAFEFKRAVAEIGRIQKLVADYNTVLVKAHELAEMGAEKPADEPNTPPPVEAGADEAKEPEPPEPDDAELINKRPDARKDIYEEEKLICPKCKACELVRIPKTGKYHCAKCNKLFQKSVGDLGEENRSTNRVAESHMSSLALQIDDLSDALGTDDPMKIATELKKKSEYSKVPIQALQKFAADWLKNKDVDENGHLKEYGHLKEWEWKEWCPKCEKNVIPIHGRTCPNCGSLDLEKPRKQESMKLFGVVMKNRFDEAVKAVDVRAKSLKEAAVLAAKKHPAWEIKHIVVKETVCKDINGKEYKDYTDIPYDLRPNDSPESVARAAKERAAIKKGPGRTQEGMQMGERPDVDDFVSDALRKKIRDDSILNTLEDNYGLSSMAANAALERGKKNRSFQKGLKKEDWDKGAPTFINKTPIVPKLCKSCRHEFRWLKKNKKDQNKNGSWPTCPKCHSTNVVTPDWCREERVPMARTNEDIPAPRQGDQGSGLMMSPDKHEMMDNTLDDLLVQKTFHELLKKLNSSDALAMTAKKFKLDWGTVSDIVGLTESVRVTDSKGQPINVRDHVSDEEWNTKTQKWEPSRETFRVEKIISPTQIQVTDVSTRKTMTVNPKDVTRQGATHIYESLIDVGAKVTEKGKGLDEELDRWTCMSCHYQSSKRFSKCPKCGSGETENLGEAAKHIYEKTTRG